MEVPCPVPLARPWSPVGYQVVELSQKTLQNAASPQVTLAEPAGPKSTVPRSPIGYRVVTVADEVVPVPRTVSRVERDISFYDDDEDIFLSPRRPRRPTSGWAICVPVVAVALVLMIPALSLGLILSRSNAPRPPIAVAAVVPEAIAVVPEGMRGDEAGEMKPDAPQAPRIGPPVAQPQPRGEAIEAAADPFDLDNRAQPAPRRDLFDTTVAFVRNPSEAYRVAKREEKLCFILHLSGNFEDPGFT